MGMTRSITVQFDLSDPFDALTYARLKESANRAWRRGRNRQAQYLLSILLGARTFESLEQTGLDDVPDFPAQVHAYNVRLRRAVRTVAQRLTKRVANGH
jgi:hypothetical protein